MSETPANGSHTSRGEQPTARWMPTDFEGWAERLAAQISNLELWKVQLRDLPQRVAALEARGGPRMAPESEARVTVLAHRLHEMEESVSAFASERDAMLRRVMDASAGLPHRVRQLMAPLMEAERLEAQQRMAEVTADLARGMDQLAAGLREVMEAGDVQGLPARLDALAEEMRALVEEARGRMRDAEKQQQARLDRMRVELAALRGRVDAVAAHAHGIEARGNRAEQRVDGIVDAVRARIVEVEEKAEALAREGGRVADALRSDLDAVASAQGSLVHRMDELTDFHRALAARMETSLGRIDGVVGEQRSLRQALEELWATVQAPGHGKQGGDGDAVSTAAVEHAIARAREEALGAVHVAVEHAVREVREKAAREMRQICEHAMATAREEAAKALRAEIEEVVAVARQEAARGVREAAAELARAREEAMREASEWRRAGAGGDEPLMAETVPEPRHEVDLLEHRPPSHLAERAAAVRALAEEIADMMSDRDRDAILAVRDLAAELEAGGGDLRVMRAQVADCLERGEGKSRTRLLEGLVPAFLDMCEGEAQVIDGVTVRTPLAGASLDLARAAGLEDLCPAPRESFDPRSQMVVAVAATRDEDCRDRVAGCFKRGYRREGRIVRRAAVTRYMVAASEATS